MAINITQINAHDLPQVDEANINKEVVIDEATAYDQSTPIDWDEQNHRHNEEIHTLRKRHSILLFALITAWLLGEFALVLLAGFKRFPFPVESETLYALSFELNEKVLIALLGTTTATVLGLYAIAARWLFNSNGNASKSKEDKKNL